MNCFYFVLISLLLCDSQHLWVSEVDLHYEGHGDPGGKGQAGSDDDGQAITCACAILCQRVSGGLSQWRDVMPGQVRGRRGQPLQSG